jgi:glycosyltransferase involved in cell wall biosynthesis
MTNKLLTIAIPTYNGGNALIEAVESCRNIEVNLSEFEVLVVDNCSTDNSIEILNSKFSDFTPLRIVKNNVNVGRIPNWNKCIIHAEGKYLLYLFANDLVGKDNHIKQTLEFFDKYPESSICSVPWIISDFKMENMIPAPQYFNRTPGIGAFDAEPHVKSILENGKLPFVCLQSNFLRTKAIRDSGIEFDYNYSITSDGLFLSDLAITMGEVCFYDKHSIIWRQDAPNRMHSHVKYHDHIEQFFNTYMIINKSVSKNGIDVARAFANYRGYEYVVLSLSGFKLMNAWYSLKVWVRLIRKIPENRKLFYRQTFVNFINSVKKFRTLFERK